MSTPRPAPAGPVTVERTDTGQFLLRDGAGHTALADSLDTAWRALQQPTTPAPPPRPTAHRWLLAAVIVLPILWLGALYLALGSVRAEIAGVAPSAAEADALKARVGALEAEVARLGAALEAARIEPPARPADAPR